MDKQLRERTIILEEAKAKIFKDINERIKDKDEKRRRNYKH